MGCCMPTRDGAVGMPRETREALEETLPDLRGDTSAVPAGIELAAARSDIRIVSAFHRAGNRTRAAGLVSFSRSHYNRKLREACGRLRVERPIDAVLVLDRLGLLP